MRIAVYEWECPSCGTTNLPIVVVSSTPAMHTTVMNNGELRMGSEFTAGVTKYFMHCGSCRWSTQLHVTPITEESYRGGDHTLEYAIYMDGTIMGPIYKEYEEKIVEE